MAASTKTRRRQAEARALLNAQMGPVVVNAASYTPYTSTATSAPVTDSAPSAPRHVSKATLARRDASWWTKASTGTKVAIIGGGVTLLVGFYLYRKATSPFRWAGHVTR